MAADGPRSISAGEAAALVSSLLLESGVRELGVHTEMLTDGIIDLYEAGVVTGSRKSTNPGKVVCSFGLGSASLCKAIDRNPDIAHPDFRDELDREARANGLIPKPFG